MPDKMNRKRCWALGVTAVVVLGAAVGCGGGAASAPQTSSATVSTTLEEDEVAAGLRDHDEHHHHCGVTLLIALSLDTLGVPPERSAAIEAIKAELHAKMQPARAAEAALHVVLAEGIAAGGVDHAKVDAALSQVVTATAGVHDVTLDALQRLHATLTPAERATLVDKVLAHWQVWQQTNAARDARGGSRDGGRLARLTSALGLTAPQRDQVVERVAGEDTAAPTLDRDEITRHIHAFGDAFVADAFDPRALATGGDIDARLAGFGAARMAHFYEAIDTVLTGDQRAKLAEILREYASYEPSATGA